MYSLEKIKDYLKNTENFMEGYSYIWACLTERQFDNKRYLPNREEKIIDIYSKEINKIAQKYNNIFLIDHTSYNKEAKKMKFMISLLERYYLINHKKPTLLNDIITDAWENAEKAKVLQLISAVCVKNNLPSGNPSWIPKLMNSFI
jgi:hypothetical protein